MSNVQEEEEEEDYMSESFLSNIVKESNEQDDRKNAMTYSERRRQKQLEHLAHLPKPLHVREKEAREKGLEKEIGEDNKGMAMLLKMGFKKGGTLGAVKPSHEDQTASSSAASDSQNPEKHDVSDRQHALRTPLAVEIKLGRGGLGMDSERKRKAEETMRRRADDAHRVYDQGYRGQKRDQFEQEKRKRQLTAAQSICMRMDAERAAKRKAEAGEAEAGETEPEDIGRSNAFWWIADSVPDELLGTRMMGPGAEVSSREQHGIVSQRAFDHSDDEDGDLESKKEKRIKLSTTLEDADVDKSHQDDLEELEQPNWGERPAFARLELPEKLEAVVQYLRDKHSYCFWCSALYNGPDDLAENCPGETEDDH
ncbi:hypothetical protein EDD11_000156 [Mortierella claussenii]|nr:hypothetical protein EDD11_000156 [Mortierella claussenii]